MLTTTFVAAASVAPRSSVAFRRTVCGPGGENERETFVADPSLNRPSSSRFQASENGPSGSLEVELNLTLWPTTGAAGENVSDAAGGWSGTGSTEVDPVSGVGTMPSVT